MSVIRDVQENNDKRDEFEIPQVDITPPPTTQAIDTSLGIQPQVEPPPQPVMQEPEMPTVPPEPNNQMPQVMDEANLDTQTAEDQQFSPMPIMPTVNEVFLQNEQVAQDVVNNKLTNMPGIHLINGDVQPSLYEIGETRVDLLERSNQLLERFNQTPRQIKHEMSQNQLQGNNPTIEPNNLDRPNASVTNQITNGMVGLLNQVGSFGKSAFEATGDFLLGDGTGEEGDFAPFRGFRKLGDEIVENPLNIWKVPFALPLGFAGGKYGEMGDGVLGATFYGLSLVQNAVVGAATDVYEIVNGTRKKGDKLNILQAIQGDDFSFTVQSSEDKPLSFVGSKENPETYQQLKDRSILWQHPLFSGGEIGLGLIEDAPRVPGILDVAQGLTDVFQEEENKGKIPFIEKLPNRVVQTQEFITGLIGDAITDPADLLTGIGRRINKGLDIVGDANPTIGRLLEGGDDIKMLPPGEPLDVPPQAADAMKETRILKGDPEIPETIPHTSREFIVNPDGSVSMGVSQPVVPELTPENQMLSMEAVLESPNASVGQVEEVLGKVIEPPIPTVTDDIIDAALPPVDPSPRLVGLLPQANTTDDLVQSVSTPRVDTQQLIEDFDLSLEEFTPISRKSNSEITTTLGLNREPLSARREQLALPPARDGLVNYVDRTAIPRVDVDDSFMTRVMDNATDEIINNPNTVPDLIRSANEVLPNDMIALNRNNMPIMARTLRNEQVYETFAKESEGLRARYVRQADEIDKTLEAIETLPDIGRRTLDSAIETGEPPVPFRQVQGNVEVPYQRRPQEFYDTPEFADNLLDTVDIDGLDNQISRAAMAGDDDTARTLSRQRSEAVLRRQRTQYNLTDLEVPDRFRGLVDTVNRSLDEIRRPGTLTPERIDELIDIQSTLGRQFEDAVAQVEFLEEVPEELFNAIQDVNRVSREATHIREYGMTLAQRVNSQPLYHGTRTVIDENFSSIDPIVGAGRSEIGTVIHTSNDSAISSIYAQATPNRNVPQELNGNLRRLSESGLVYEVQPTVRSPKLVSEPLNGVDAEVIKNAIRKTPLNDSRIKGRLARVAKEGRSYEEIMSKIDDVLIEEFADFPEQFALNLQRSIVTDLRDFLGIDALVKLGDNDYMQVGLTGVPGRQNTIRMSKPSNLELVAGDVPQTPIQKQSYMKYKGEQITSNLYPDSQFAKVNEMEALVKYQTEELSLTTQRLKNSERVGKITASELVESEQALKQLSDLEYKKSKATKMETFKKQNERLMSSFNTVEKGIC